MSDVPTVKLLTLGDSEVGKSALILRFSDNSFNLNRVKTLGIDSKTKDLTVDGRVIRVQVWDTAGQEKYHTISYNFYNRSDGILLVYDVTNEDSLRNVRNWMKQINEHTKNGALIVLVANKTDLFPQEHYPEGERLAAEFGCQLFCTSALSGENVNNAFTYLTQEIVRRRPEILQNAPKTSVHLDQTQETDHKKKGICC